MRRFFTGQGSQVIVCPRLCFCARPKRAIAMPLSQCFGRSARRFPARRERPSDSSWPDRRHSVIAPMPWTSQAALRQRCGMGWSLPSLPCRTRCHRFVKYVRSPTTIGCCLAKRRHPTCVKYPCRLPQPLNALRVDQSIGREAFSPGPWPSA